MDKLRVELKIANDKAQADTRKFKDEIANLNKQVRQLIPFLLDFMCMHQQLLVLKDTTAVGSKQQEIEKLEQVIFYFNERSHVYHLSVRMLP